VVFLGTGPLLLLVAYQYAKAGAEVAAVLDTSGFGAKARAAPGLLWNTPTFFRGLRYMAALRARRVPLYEGVTPLAIEGEGNVAAVVWRDARGVEHRTTCDAAAMGWGLKPEAQLADLAGVPFRFDSLQHNWVPQKDAAGRSPVPGVYLAGDGASIGGAEVAELAGARAALALLQDHDIPVDAALTTHLDRRLRAEARFRAALERAFPFPAPLAAGMADTTILCRCEAVTAGEFRAALRDTAPTGAAREVNRAKAFSRVGMGRCQGRVCGPAAAEILAAEQGCDIEQAGRLRGQPPVKPLPMPLVTTTAVAAQ
jgi:NADPH-dependent 2,4-dienoyl-CoA reductase/sulfur reductase-like enzyme